MSFEDDYKSVLPELEKIPAEEIWAPNIPIDRAAQLALNLYKWVQPDKDILESHGLDWNQVLSVPTRSGALRHANNHLKLVRGKKKEAKHIWDEKSQGSVELRYFLIRTFRYAFKNLPEALEQLRAITEGARQSDMVDDLDALGKLGKANLNALNAIKFDTSFLDIAQNAAIDLADYLSDYRSAKVTRGDVEMRNRAYTYLQMVVTDIRSCGQYSFHGKMDRLSGYTIPFQVSTRSKTQKEGDAPEPLMPESETGS